MVENGMSSALKFVWTSKITIRKYYLRIVSVFDLYGHHPPN